MLSLGREFNKPLRGFQWPSSLITLAFGRDFNQCLGYKSPSHSPVYVSNLGHLIFCVSWGHSNRGTLSFKLGILGSNKDMSNSHTIWVNLGFLHSNSNPSNHASCSKPPPFRQGSWRSCHRCWKRWPLGWSSTKAWKAGDPNNNRSWIPCPTRTPKSRKQI